MAWNPALIAFNGGASSVDDFDSGDTSLDQIGVGEYWDAFDPGADFSDPGAEYDPNAAGSDGLVDVPVDGSITDYGDPYYAENTSGVMSDTTYGNGQDRANSNVDPTADPAADDGGQSKGSRSPSSGMPQMSKTKAGGGQPPPSKKPVVTQPPAKASFLPKNPTNQVRSPGQAARDPRLSAWPIYNPSGNTGFQPAGSSMNAPSYNRVGGALSQGINPQIFLYVAGALALFAIVKH